jgi:hypothetical protein
MERFEGKNENPITSDIGFQPEVVPEGVSASELVDFFIAHLSAPRPEAFEAMSVMEDESQRDRLRAFLNQG